MMTNDATPRGYLHLLRLLRQMRRTAVPGPRRCTLSGFTLAAPPFQHTCLILFSVLLCALVLLPAPALAAEIGAVRQLSHAGQPLYAEVELSASPEELQQLQVRLALPDVYRLGNIRRHPILNSTRVQLRHGDRPVLILQSAQAITDHYLNLYLEFIDGRNDPKQHSVRALTLWLESDPNPPEPNPLSLAASAPPSHAAVKDRDSEHPDGDLADGPLSLNGPVVGAVPAQHIQHATRTEVADTARPPVMQRPKMAIAQQPPAPHASPTMTGAAATAGNCGEARQQARRCVLTDIENQRISNELTVLEEKVDILKRVVLSEEAPPAVETPPPPVEQAAPKTVPKSSKKIVETAFPWKIVLISAAVFVVVTMLAFALLTMRSRAKAKAKGESKAAAKAAPKAKAKTGKSKLSAKWQAWWSGLRAKFGKKSKAQEPAAEAHPDLDIEQAAAAAISSMHGGDEGEAEQASGAEDAKGKAGGKTSFLSRLRSKLPKLPKLRLPTLPRIKLRMPGKKGKVQPGDQEAQA